MLLLNLIQNILSNFPNTTTLSGWTKCLYLSSEQQKVIWSPVFPLIQMKDLIKAQIISSYQIQTQMIGKPEVSSYDK